MPAQWLSPAHVDSARIAFTWQACGVSSAIGHEQSRPMTRPHAVCRPLYTPLVTAGAAMVGVIISIAAGLEGLLAARWRSTLSVQDASGSERLALV